MAKARPDKPSIIEFVKDDRLLGLSLSEHQETLLRAIDGLPLSSHQLDIFRACTGRKRYNEKPCRESSVICGARGGKTGRIATTHAAHKAAFGNHTKRLSRGERATFPLIAQDFKAGRVAFGYLSDYFSNSPLLSTMLAEPPLSSEIRLVNRTDIVVFPCKRAAVRAYSIPKAYLDETSMWRFEGSTDADIEIETSVRRGTVQFSDAQIIKTSTPYLKDGIMYRDYQNHWGVDDSPVLVWKAGSLAMNPTLAESEQLDVQRQLDPLRYSREYEAEFIDALECFIPAAWIESAVRRGKQDNPPKSGVAYVKAIDQSELRGDHFTLAIGHVENNQGVIDLVRGWSGNGSKGVVDLEGTVKEIVEIGKRYGTAHFVGDQEAKDWVEQEFRRAGASFVKSQRNTSTCYLESEPFFAQGRIELPDNPTLIRELKLLERNTRPGGRIMVTHPRGSHDDFATAVCRVIGNLAGATVDTKGIAVVGERMVTRRGWDDADEDGSAINRMWDSGELLKRSW